MAKKSGVGHGLIIDGYELGFNVSVINNSSAAVNPLPVTAIDSSHMEHLAGIRSHVFDMGVFFDKATDRMHARMKLPPSTDVKGLWYFGSTLGDVMAWINGKQDSYDLSNPEDRNLQGNILIHGNNPSADEIGREFGRLATPGLITRSTATDETGLVEAQTTAGGIAFVQITALSSGTPTILFEDSSDTTNGVDGSWSSLRTVAIQTANTAERSKISGTIEKGVRITTSGTFSGLIFIAGFVRLISGDIRPTS